MNEVPKVLVGMSGGVDSSVAAALLVEAGYDVTGAYMKNWTLDVPGMQCPWAEDLAYAKRTAVKLGIDLRVYDFQDAYKHDVVDYLVREYEAGRTPNPDIMCNQDVKFGLFLETALAEGFDYIATGHYASCSAVLTNSGQVDAAVASDTSSSSCKASSLREVRGSEEDSATCRSAVRPAGSCASLPHAFEKIASQSEEEGVQTVASPSSATLGYDNSFTDSSTTCDSPQLLRAVDAHKDQTYFLYRMGQAALARTLFPLGEFTKQQVREMAEARGLPAANKPDSQGICFIGEAPIQDFLRMYVQPNPGKIIDVDTHEVVGAHDGALFFTLGQRKGLGVGGGQPYYVVGKDMAANEVYVSHNPQAAALQTTELQLENCTWLAGEAPQEGSYLVRTRHTGPLVEAHFTPQATAQASLAFTQPQERVAPGQSAVLYSGDICLGGGIVS
ncbi:MAG: tRNA-specific 2-thiouridylase [Eggerthellaceae bacterium]|nr:tRNA-specific 2-thiouridylase [Eggerthellaceae bacterium]